MMPSFEEDRFVYSAYCEAILFSAKIGSARREFFSRKKMARWHKKYRHHAALADRPSRC